jgi:hypothetical protein
MSSGADQVHAPFVKVIRWPAASGTSADEFTSGFAQFSLPEILVCALAESVRAESIANTVIDFRITRPPMVDFLSSAGRLNDAELGRGVK